MDEILVVQVVTAAFGSIMGESHANKENQRAVFLKYEYVDVYVKR